MDGEDRVFSAARARGNLYFYARYMFLQRRKYNWRRAAHHKIVCAALERVFRGDCRRLIINIPPRYSKTELVAVNFMTWCLGKVPDAEFIYTSYSGHLATQAAWQAREIVSSDSYQEIFPNTIIRSDSSAKHEWRTTAGGCVYAVGAGGTITGYGAGKMRERFGGCFAYDELVSTETGLVPIGDIVTKRLNVRVYSFNEKTGAVELRPIDTLWTNPGNRIIEVGLSDGATFRSTPNHRIMTDAGWVEAKDLTARHCLPGNLSQIFEPVQADSKTHTGDISWNRTIKGNSEGFLSKLVSTVPCWFRKVLGDRDPSFSHFDLSDNTSEDAVTGGKCLSRVLAGEDANYGFAGKFCAWASFKNRECSVPFSICDVVGTGPIGEIYEAVVEWVAIQMATIKTILAWPNKRLQYELVNEFGRDTRAYGKVDSIIAAPKTWLKESLWDKIIGTFARDKATNAFNSPEIAHSIQPIKAHNRFPVFIRDIGHVAKTYCLEVRGNHNFYVSQSQVLVSNCIIIDDPHKAEEIRSDLVRKNVLDWFPTTLESRKNSPDTPIILMMQRLHEEDLAGWLLDGGNGEKWESIVLPAICEDGTALWPEMHSIDRLHEMERASPYTFAGQYMQRPTPVAGGLFKPDEIAYCDNVQGVTKWVRAWDLAATQEDGDWTVGTLMGHDAARHTYIADVVRLQGRPDDVEKAIVATAFRDSKKIKISLPQDPGQAGKSQIAYLTRALAGYPVVATVESGDKVTRAEPLASQVNLGSVSMVHGEWNNGLINEMRYFPFGKHDDQVDSCSRAFNHLCEAKTPWNISDRIIERFSQQTSYGGY